MSLRLRWTEQAVSQLGAIAEFISLSSPVYAEQVVERILMRLRQVQQFPEHLRIRADVMLEVERLIAARGLTQAEAAKVLHVTQPRISDLTRGKIDRFSIDTLVEMLSRAGADVTFKVRRRRHPIGRSGNRSNSWVSLNTPDLSRSL